MSHKVIVTGTGATATAAVSEAKIADILTTAISTDSAVTGTYGLIQKAGLVVLGMGFQSSRKGGSWNFLA
jgi:hypothetical protein